MRFPSLCLVLLLLLVPPLRAAQWTVEIYDFYFTPTNLTIAAGDTVVWSNKVLRAHDTTQYDPQQPEELLWASDLLAQDETFSFTFTNAGYFPYVCAVHYFTRPQQTGTVSVIQPNVPPTVSLTNPPNGSVLLAPANFTLIAQATDSDGSVTQVEFFVDEVSLGISFGPMFAVPVSGLEMGEHILSAVATDNQGATATASPVSITVQESPPASFALNLGVKPPFTGGVQITPAANGPNGSYLDGTIVTLRAVADAGFAFTNWSPEFNMNNPLIILVKSNVTLVAEFVPYIPPVYRLDVLVNLTNAGSVAVTPGPDDDGNYQDGTPVALAARPNAGFYFVNWSGATNSTNNPLLLVMNVDKSISANFAAIPPLDFAALHGSFAGLLLDSSETNFATSGWLAVRLTSSGAYRGTAIIGGMRQSIRGQFDRFGYAPLVLRQGTLSGSLQLNTAGDHIAGILTDGKKSPRALLYRKPTAGSIPTGDYTVIVAVTPPLAASGLLKLHVASSGASRMRGTLGDGTAFRTSGFVSAGGRMGVFDSLYHGRGAIFGWLDISPNGIAQGHVRWFRPADSRSQSFPAGFAIVAPMNGLAESVQQKRLAKFRFLANDALCGSPAKSLPASTEKSTDSLSR